ncbi:Protein-S-isoprenylcysteine O-methyltransferase [Mycena venus]|uniref:Protein-S-isoprenylcysteine O-methyltransferase n=1 Tax=Mycena venus TaxID=2733690 RepID=A0A8H7CKT9_9AGAR|nr:Protein-S-isoprenylcysteine O-methyltransferase [Mycena venus]
MDPRIYPCLESAFGVAESTSKESTRMDAGSFKRSPAGFTLSKRMPPLLKIPLILADSFCMRITATPPNPPLPPGQHIVYIPDWRERFLRSLAWPSVVLRTISHTLNVLQICLIIASHNPTGAFSNYILLHAAPAACNDRLTITPVFAVGLGITIAGTALRVVCYRTLGRHFTFELSLQPAHKLIACGPYAFVRHPSYTALMLTLVGGWITLALRGSYVWECIWVCVALAVIASLVLRMPREDEILRKRFGEEWDEWKRAVPWKVVPWVF